MVTSSVSCLFLISAWANAFAPSHQRLSPATLSDCFKALEATADGLGLSLLPSIRPALAEAVGERYSLRYEPLERGLAANPLTDQDSGI